MNPLKYLSNQINSFILNHIVNHIHIYFFRRSFFKLFGIQIGKRSIIDCGLYILSPDKLKIGSFTHINRGCFLDARGSLEIGNNVSISHNVSIVSASHNTHSETFDYLAEKITVKDHCWIGLNSIILKGVTLEEGTIIAAGSVVTKDTEPYSIYAGIPAKKIGERKITDINYNCTEFLYYKGIRKPYLS